MGDENDFTSKRVLPEKQKIDESDRNKTNGDEIELIQNDSMDGAADKKHSEMNEDVKQGNSNENIQNTQEKCSPVGFAYLVPPCLSLFGFVADIAFDILLLKKYHSEGKQTYFYLTLAFILIPALILIIIDLTWLYIDYSFQKKKLHDQIESEEEGTEMIDSANSAQHKEIDNKKVQDVSSPLWFVCRIILALLSLGIIVRICQHMCYKHKKRTVRKYRDYYSERVIATKRDYAMLNFIHAFTESYSQAALQLYIFALNPVSLNSKIGGSIITSILLMPLAFADHYRSLRIQSPQGVIDKKRDMIFLVYFFYYLGVLGGMMFRIVSISMFYAAVPPGISLTLVNIHCLLVFFWFLFYHKPSYEGMLITRVRSLRLLYKWLYTALYSVASMLFFVDLYESEGTRSSSKNRMICYNVVLYIESTVFIVLGFVWASLDIQLYATVLLVGFLLHVVFIPNYYQFLHPTVGICNSCAETSETVTTEQVENIVSNPQQSNPAEPAAKD